MIRSSDPYASALGWAHRTYGEPLGCGLYRHVFAEDPEHVIKVPRGEWGEYCNSGEVREYRTNTDGTLAKCEVFEHPSTGVLLQRMERIVRFPESGEFDALPTWTHYIDCQQVGWTADGRLVAYDWVYPPGR